MIVKLTAEQIAATGAKDPADFSTRLSALLADSQKLATVMAEQPTIAALVTRVEALEKVPCGTTEARVKEIITAESAGSIKAFLATAEGKQLVGAEASRITMEAIASIGTTPNKPSPAAGAPAGTDVAALEAAGEYEKAFALLPAETRADFADAKSYASYQKANRKGAVIVNQRN